MKHIILSFCFVLIYQPLFAQSFSVTTSDDQGEGSLRQAFIDAKSTGGEIKIETEENITLNSGLVYDGQKPIKLTGRKNVIKLKSNETLLYISAGADFSGESFILEGARQYNVSDGDASSQPAAKGIYVEIPSHQKDDVNFELKDVEITNMEGMGIHISDCDLRDRCGRGQGHEGDGSDASISVNFENLYVSDVGHGALDHDGVRIDERGAGDIMVISENSIYLRNGSDGLELDEGGEGSIIATLVSDRYVENGGYCNPDIMGLYLHQNAHRDFEDEVATDADIPQKINGSPDASCIELDTKYYESGFLKSYKYSLDLDDGVDIDEADDGDIRLIMKDVLIAHNFDEGGNFDELGNGDVNAEYMNVVMEGNFDEGSKHNESGRGGIYANIQNSRAFDNHGEGFVFEEKNEGNVKIRAVAVQTSGNDDQKNSGVIVEQKGKGNGEVVFEDVNIDEGIDVVGATVTGAF